LSLVYLVLNLKYRDLQLHRSAGMTRDDNDDDDDDYYYYYTVIIRNK